MKILWSYLAPFWYKSRVWQTDGRTDRQTPRRWLRRAMHCAIAHKKYRLPVTACIINCVWKWHHWASNSRSVRDLDDSHYSVAGRRLPRFWMEIGELSGGGGEWAAETRKHCQSSSAAASRLRCVVWAARLFCHSRQCTITVHSICLCNQAAALWLPLSAALPSVHATCADLLLPSPWH